MGTNFDFVTFYLERKQELENCKRKRQNSSPLVKRTLEILIQGTEEGLKDNLELPFKKLNKEITDYDDWRRNQIS